MLNSEKFFLQRLMPVVVIFSAIMMISNHLDIVLAVDTGTPGEIGTKNNSEPYYSPLNLTGPETIQSLESVEGSNTGFFANDTSISNPNNTASNSIATNVHEGCFAVSNQTSPDCP